MYKAIDLARYIVAKCIREDEPISNLQLQKILYYIQKEFLKQRNTPAFADRIEAWQFGPVVPNVYDAFCHFGGMPITMLLQKVITIEERDADLIDQIIVAKRSLKPWQLVAETHQPGGAWEKIYQNGKGRHQIIPVPLIKDRG